MVVRAEAEIGELRAGRNVLERCFKWHWISFAYAKHFLQLEITTFISSHLDLPQGQRTGESEGIYRPKFVDIIWARPPYHDVG